MAKQVKDRASKAFQDLCDELTRTGKDYDDYVVEISYESEEGLVLYDAEAKYVHVGSDGISFHPLNQMPKFGMEKVLQFIPIDRLYSVDLLRKVND